MSKHRKTTKSSSSIFPGIVLSNHDDEKTTKNEKKTKNPEDKSPVCYSSLLLDGTEMLAIKLGESAEDDRGNDHPNSAVLRNAEEEATERRS